MRSSYGRRVANRKERPVMVRSRSWMEINERHHFSTIYVGLQVLSMSHACNDTVSPYFPIPNLNKASSSVFPVKI